MTSGGDVLVIEDDTQINELIGAYVQLAGLGYRGAFDGITGLRLAHERRPRLVILDLMLPDMDGFEICAKLRADPAMGKVPVLILTALDQQQSIHRGTTCGAAAYLTKPFDPDVLLATIRQHAA
jgi:DNA-binding response OmpR family regulator